MVEGKTPETETDLLQAILDLFDDVESMAPEDMQEIDEALRAAGLDPDAVAKRMDEVAQQAITASPFNWRNQTRQMKAAQERLAAQRAARPTDREGMMTAIKKYFGLSNPEIQQVALAHRNFTSLPVEDLATLLDELEYLAGQDSPERED
jgi:hypothetical protein